METPERNSRPSSAGTNVDEVGTISINPRRLSYGVISSGFYYNLKFSVKNNTLQPIRIRVFCTPHENEKNSMRLVKMPERIAPGMEASLLLELTATCNGISRFTVQVKQNFDGRIYTRTIDANIVNPETFKYVKKSLQLQKRPVYKTNVRCIGAIPGAMVNSSIANITQASEAMLMDDDDIEDLLDYPSAPNVYWDPYDKCLRIDPQLGQVYVDPQISLEESYQRTLQLRNERLKELEEEGFITSKVIDQLGMHRTFLISGGGEEDGLNVAEAENEDENDDTVPNGLSSFHRPPLNSQMSFNSEDDHNSSRSSMRSAVSIASLLAMKREKIDQRKRATLDAAKEFAKDSKQDTLVDSMRTLNMIIGRNRLKSTHDVSNIIS